MSTGEQRDREVKLVLAGGQVWQKAAIIDVLGVPGARVTEALARLHAQGQIERVAHGQWRLA